LTRGIITSEPFGVITHLYCAETPASVIMKAPGVLRGFVEKNETPRLGPTENPFGSENMKSVETPVTPCHKDCQKLGK